MHIRFEAKTVAVTGAGHGFGRAIARGFATLGARVFATDISFENLKESAAPGGIDMQAVDLRDRIAAAWIQSIETATGGAIEVLVNNAGGVAGQGAGAAGGCERRGVEPHLQYQRERGDLFRLRPRGFCEQADFGGRWRTIAVRAWTHYRFAICAGLVYGAAAKG